MRSINQSTDQLIPLLTTLADSPLIMSQRLSEWTGHGPALEQDIAMTNIALDYLGQARHFYQYIAEIKADGSTEDSIAYLRDAHQYRNHLLVELPNSDWGQTILKIFFFAAFQKSLYEQVVQVKNDHLSAIAEKSLKEVKYHLTWSSDWVIRLGDGTNESKERMVKAIDYLWDYTGELFESISIGTGAINNDLARKTWFETVERVFEKASLLIPSKQPFQTGGLKGIHTEHLGFMLTEMQWLQRVYPNSEW